MAYRNRAHAFPEVGYELISGSAVATGGAVNVAVTYGRTYSTPPKVFLTMASGPGGSAALVPRVVNETATGFSIYVYNTGSSAATWSNLRVNWMAVAG